MGEFGALNCDGTGSMSGTAFSEATLAEDMGAAIAV
jgi:hypothetical protein